MSNINILSIIIPFIATLIASLLAGLVSFLLFVFSPNNNVKSKRMEIVFESMDSSCETLLGCITEPNREDLLEALKYVQDTIFLYGTKNETKIMSHIKPEMFRIFGMQLNEENRFYSLASLTLLVNVIRRETYKKQVLSNYIFKTYLKDYSQIKGELDKEYNKLVIYFGLSSKYLIKTNNKEEVFIDRR